MDLSITFKEVTVHLNLNESLTVINALAIFRSRIRGSSWSALRKNVEYPLLKSMRMFFEVPEQNYSKGNRDFIQAHFFASDMIGS